MKDIYRTDEQFVLYFGIFTGTSIKNMDTHLLVKRSDALAQEVLALDPTVVKLSESRR